MIRLGILGCSEIAFRRFLPAVKNLDQIKAVVVAEEYDKNRIRAFNEPYGLEVADHFESILKRDDIDAVYIPQPPALHAFWAGKALAYHKHVLVEKPAACTLEETNRLVVYAATNQLALHENYVFPYHAQIRQIQKLLAEGRIGEIRLIRADFSFPLRKQDDFRYQKKLGGGALLDAGGYPVKLASMLLGDGIRVETARLQGVPGYEVDMYGSATLSDENGTVCQIGFGMDCCYQCSLEIVGSRGRIRTDRIFTAPRDYEAVIFLETGTHKEAVSIAPDSCFEHSVTHFLQEIHREQARKSMYDEMLRQAGLVADIQKKGRDYADYI